MKPGGWQAGKPVGIACAMKNAGVGVGAAGLGPCAVCWCRNAKLHIYAGASCISQGLGTVLVQMTADEYRSLREMILFMSEATAMDRTDSGTTSGSRQTMITGEACRRACEKLMEAKGSDKSLKDLIGQEFYGGLSCKDGSAGADAESCFTWPMVMLRRFAFLMKTGKIDRMICSP